MSDNRREFFRVSFVRAISGKITNPEKHEAFVDISSLSAGGLVFTAYFEFALREQVLCSFELLDEPFQLEGTVIRKIAKEYDWEYAVQFTAGQKTSSQLFKQLNTYQIRKRKSVLND